MISNSSSSSNNPGGLSVSIPPAPPEEEVVEVVVVSDEEGHHGPPPELLEELQGNKRTLVQVHTQRTFTHTHTHTRPHYTDTGCVFMYFSPLQYHYYIHKREMGSFADFFSLHPVLFYIMLVIVFSLFLVLVGHDMIIST